MTTILFMALAMVQGGPFETRDFAVGDQFAYLMLPPVSICDSSVTEFVWSEDGDRLLTVRGSIQMSPAAATEFLGPNPPKLETLRPRMELYVTNSKSLQTTKFWTGNLAMGRIQSPAWLEKTPYVLAILERGEQDQGLISIHSSTGKTSILTTLPADRMLAIYPSPTRSTAAIVFGPEQPGEPFHVRLVSSNLSLSEPVPLPIRTAGVVWSKNGTQLYSGIQFSATPEGHRRTAAYQLDSSRGEFVRSSTAQSEVLDPVGTPELYVQTMQQHLRPGGEVKAPMIWLYPGTAKPADAVAGIVTTDGKTASLSPGNNAIAYAHQGGAMIRQITRVPKEAYLKSLADAQKLEAMNRAKQVGTAMMIYSADTDDDSLPPNAGWEDRIMPYVKNRDLLSGFNYTFGGGPLTNPSETSIGFVSGPGGRAVVYGDGHVKWVPN